MIRRCDECGKIMTEGYCIEDGAEYYCSDECLHKHISEEEFLKLYADGEGSSYWTEWEPEDGTMWIARDPDDSLFLFQSKPYFNYENGLWTMTDKDYSYLELPEDLFPEQDFGDEPIPVMLVRKKMEE